MKYFETKIVKIKPKRTLQVNPRGAGKSIKYWRCLSDEILERLKINAKRELERRKTIKSKPKGNWVNGENLDKIQFPCYCRFDSNKGINGSGSGQCVKGIGRIDQTFEEGQVQFQISIADYQTKDLSVLCATPSLKRLFEIYVPKILKAKLIIFDDDLEDKYNDD